MPTVVGREMCGGMAITGIQQWCFTRSSNSAWPRVWITDPDRLIAKATARGLEPADLLCVGCERRRQRLITEGRWP